MTALLIVSWSILGGLWRRMFGGWLGLPRSICYTLMVPLTLPVWLALPWGVMWPYSALAGVAFTALALLFFVVSCYPGGRYDNTRDVLLKYGPFGIGYVWAKKYIPSEWGPNSFFDGWASVGEVFLGASFWGCVGVVWWWVV
jgi:hypothetical protein